LRLFCHEWGDAKAPRLVCLHGVTSHGGRFHRLAERLSAHFHVVAPDLRGHGRSGWEPPWSAEAHVADVLETVGHERLVWLGHSFGGRLVATLAGSQPQLVERAILLDPAVQVLPHVALDMAELERQDTSFSAVEEAVQLRYDSGRVLLAPREMLLEDEAAHLDAGPDGRLRYRYCKSAVIACWSEMASDPPPPARVPTLIVLGRQSWLVLDKQLDRYRQELGELVEIVHVPGGHTVFWDALGETGDTIEAFLGGSTMSRDRWRRFDR
jgi:lipase